MPLYKFVGNRILSWFQNRMLGASLSEFHSGYRVYSVAALKKMPFELNTNDFHFDTEIIIQLLLAGLRIAELPIPTYYGDEICRVNGLKYAWDVTKAVLVARTQQLGLFYDRRFDCAPAGGQLAVRTEARLPEPAFGGARSRARGLAGARSGLCRRIRRRHAAPPAALPGHWRRQVSTRPAACELDAFVLHDLNDGLPPLNAADYDHVLLLDVIEHLASPETFVEQLRRGPEAAPGTRVLVSTANIGFLVNRLMLLFGQFNYGKRGILDLTHTRLFTFESFRRLFEQGGFRVAADTGHPRTLPAGAQEQDR